MLPTIFIGDFGGQPQRIDGRHASRHSPESPTFAGACQRTATSSIAYCSPLLCSAARQVQSRVVVGMLNFSSSLKPFDGELENKRINRAHKRCNQSSLSLCDDRAGTISGGAIRYTLQLAVECRGWQGISSRITA
jgi:hypothetical protein